LSSAVKYLTKFWVYSACEPVKCPKSTDKKDIREPVSDIYQQTLNKVNVDGTWHL